MPNPSISMPDDMRQEIEHRREKGTSVAEYVRDALDARFDLEDTNNWPPNVTFDARTEDDDATPAASAHE